MILVKKAICYLSDRAAINCSLHIQVDHLILQWIQLHLKFILMELIRNFLQLKFMLVANGIFVEAADIYTISD